MTSTLHGRTIAVVGAGGGIGRTVCSRLLSEGANVVAFDRAPAELDGLEVHECDAADLGSVQSAFGAHLVPEEVSGLVNLVGLFEIVDFVDTDPAHWKAMIDANLLSAMTTAHVLLPAWLERGSGSIVNSASTAGEFGSIRPSAAYAAAKGGVIAFSKSLAREVSPRGVRVNVVSPGPVQTPMLQAESGPAHREAVARTLLGRLGAPADIAAAIAFLIGDDADWITGEVLRVNGGSLL